MTCELKVVRLLEILAMLSCRDSIHASMRQRDVPTRCSVKKCIIDYKVSKNMNTVNVVKTVLYTLYVVF